MAVFQIEALFEKIFPLGVSQLVHGATRMERGQPKTGLDHLYSNKPNKLSAVQTFFTGMSDHKLIKVTRYTKSLKEVPRYVKKRTFKDFDEKLFRERLGQYGLEEIFLYTDVDSAAELLTSKLTVILDEMAPIRKIQTRKKYVPWLSKGTKSLMKVRNEAQEKATETGNPDDWRMYRAIRNQVTARCRTDKAEWEREKLDHINNTSTDTWQTVKGWLGWGSAGTPTKLFSDGRLVTSPGGLAACMNNFFLDKIKRLRQNIPAATADPLMKLREATSHRNCSLNLKLVSEDHVLKLIKNLRNSSATGVDYIDTRTIKLVADLIAPQVTHIINLSILTSTYPTMWKWAKVIPLLKSTQLDSIMPKSYRPVALLPVLSKLLEKVVFSQVVEYLEENKLIHPNLHGSRAGHNTATALLQLYDRWVEEVEEGKMVGVLFCDQSAAFDLCDNNILAEKLKLLGLEEQALTWIKSYLSGRKQSCFIDGELSTPLNLLSCGVPQGSIGGPLLWLCFTCDQPDVIHDHEVKGEELHRGCGVQQLPGNQGGTGQGGDEVQDTQSTQKRQTVVS